MLQYRAFRNVDPPTLVSIWRSRSGQPALRQPVTVDLLEQLVFGKIYFGDTGLFLAFDDDRPVGFAHAAFGPNEARNGMSTETGIICMVVVRPDCAEAEVAAGLLETCETYLRQRGASVVYGGAVSRISPFYLGLYGDGNLPGVLDTDTVPRHLYESSGYQPIERTLVFARDLWDYRPPVDRSQVQFRRRMIVEVTHDPKPETWWEACTVGDFEVSRFDLIPRGGNSPLARLTVRDSEPTGFFQSGQAVDLMDVHVHQDHRRQGLATYLLRESFRQLTRQSVGRVTGQLAEKNEVGIGLYKKLGLEQVEQATVFQKRIDRG